MKELIDEFVKYNKLLIVGVIAGLVSGIFFSVYSDLRIQTDNFYRLFLGSLFVTIFYYFIIMIVSFIIYQIAKKV